MEGERLTSFVALYRGETIAAARLVAVSAEPALVRDLAKRILAEPENEEPDAVLQQLERGRRRALQLVKTEASE
jgi:hypothetical protein